MFLNYITQATFCWKPHQNRTFSSRDMGNVSFEKQFETNEVVFFDGLYLKINIADKQLIQLDHITYVHRVTILHNFVCPSTGYSEREKNTLFLLKFFNYRTKIRSLFYFTHCQRNLSFFANSDFKLLWHTNLEFFATAKLWPL